ncbi:LysE/ArgO family amino acid transporter [Candidatus Thioglobus sp.]|nr:LysE/ArgO family amino acid transporter [Candidatus Thioglobus sp.]
MLPAFLTGFFLGLSLIIAIGAQNSFVLRQGILGQHVFYVALFCALADALLISIGVAGISFFLSNIINQISSLLFGFSALWLTGYGVLRLKAVFKADIMVEIESSKSEGLIPTLSIAAILTFANPHVYLDTMVLIGSISQQFSGYYRIAFALGACLSSFVFFFSLAYGARLLEPIMKTPSSWRILDGLIALIMFIIAFKLASAGNWL